MSYETAPNFKLVLLGESSVGKTSIVNVMHGGEFIEDQQSTVGACFQIKKMKIEDTLVNLHLWDTAGQERFRSLAPMYYRDAQFTLLIYAINNVESFNELDTWYQGLCDDCPKMPKVVVIGNKSDLEAERQITKEQGQELASKYRASFFEVSAKEGKEGIVKMFEHIAKVALRTMPLLNMPEQNNYIVEEKEEEEKKKGCCK